MGSDRKNATMKDIANAAGVSVATVSYVLNHSSTQKISHETRLRIFALAREMNYVPNLSAKSLSGRNSRLIGILLGSDARTSSSRMQGYYELVDALEREAAERGYDVVLSCAGELENGTDVIPRRVLDGVLFVDATQNNIHAITRKYYVPIVFLDSYIDDTLFYKVVPHYARALEQAMALLSCPPQNVNELFFAMDERCNQAMASSICERFLPDHVFIHNGSADFEAFLQRMQGRKGIVLGEMLGLAAERSVPAGSLAVILRSGRPSLLKKETLRVQLDSRRLAGKALDQLIKLIDLKENPEEEKVILT